SPNVVTSAARSSTLRLSTLRRFGFALVGADHREALRVETNRYVQLLRDRRQPEPLGRVLPEPGLLARRAGDCGRVAAHADVRGADAEPRVARGVIAAPVPDARGRVEVDDGPLDDRRRVGPALRALRLRGLEVAARDPLGVVAVVAAVERHGGYP